MRTHPSAGPQGDPTAVMDATLRLAAREIVQSAESIREVARRTSELLTHPELARALPARAALLRALTNGAGLGHAVEGEGGFTRLLGRVGEMCGRESLAALVAVTSLRLRIEAVLVRHPELVRDPAVRRVLNAVTADRDLESLRALRALMKQHGAGAALARLTPIAPELTAIRALLDENPFNDETGWNFALGRDFHAEPYLGGVPARPSAAPDRGEGSAVPVELTGQQARDLTGVGAESSLMGFLRNIAALLNDGKILIQDVQDIQDGQGPDGTVRYVVHAPGMAPGRPRNDSPQDFVGAWSHLFESDSPYTRGIRLAIEAHGVPDGAELALIGHSEGGIALMNLAQDPDFCARYRVTHVVAVGSPVDHKKIADPGTWVASVTNQHDLVTVLDGRGAGTVFDPHPGWYEVDYVDPTHDYPACHTIGKYVDNLAFDLPEARRDIEAALAPSYHGGTVTRSQVYQLKDRAHPPQGYPFMAVPTTPVDTSAGPVDTPVRYYDSATVIAVFTADAQAARRLLPAESWLSPAGLRDRCLIALQISDHRVTPLGPYAELSVAVLVNDLWRPRPYDVVRDLLRRADLRRAGRYVVGVAVTSPEAQAASGELWGQPAALTPMDLELGGRCVRASVDGPDPDEPMLELLGPLGPSVPFPHIDSVLYARAEDTVLRTLVHTQGRLKVHPAPRLRLHLGRTDHPLPAALRELGLDGARPLAAVHLPAYMSRRSAGTPLPR